MPENAVTHEQLRAGQMALLGRFDEYQRQNHETTGMIFSKLDKVIDASHANHVFLTEIKGQVDGMQDTRDTHIARLVTAENAIKLIEAENNRHEGERGVLAAILRSPFIAWFAAAGAILWTALKGAAAHVP